VELSRETGGIAVTSLALAARVDAPRDTYEFETAAGVCSPDEFRAAELALVEALWGRDLGRLLLVEGNYGVPAVVLADASSGVTVTESSARAAALCEANAARNGVGAAVRVANVAEPLEMTATADSSFSGAREDGLDGTRGNDFDVAAYAPKPYTPLAVAKQRLVGALACLRPGGRLFVAARERSGLARFADALRDLSGGVETVAEVGDCSVLVASRPASGSLDDRSFVEPRRLSATVGGVDLSLVSVPGVFAAGGLDHGTRLLLETADVADGDRVLDLCCGYGAAGVWAGSGADCSVTLTDDDRVATRCAECSLSASGVDGEVVTADGTAGVASRRFDTVLCNPPTHAGDAVLRELFDGARRVLAGSGTLWVVHHDALDLHPQLSVFRRVQVAARGEEHVVLRATG
jgi:23S rRNA (guanine1835-N2)-methyltransferase